MSRGDSGILIEGHTHSSKGWKCNSKLAFTFHTYSDGFFNWEHEKAELCFSTLITSSVASQWLEVLFFFFLALLHFFAGAGNRHYEVGIPSGIGHGGTATL